MKFRQAELEQTGAIAAGNGKSSSEILVLATEVSRLNLKVMAVERDLGATLAQFRLVHDQFQSMLIQYRAEFQRFIDVVVRLEKRLNAIGRKKP